jgi:methyltransferase (TIGR00027 family)
MKSRTPEQRAEDTRLYEEKFPGHRNSILTRVRFFDDITQDELARGTTQFVIVGAGYDTRAYRISGLNKARVFEVDIAETQQKKKAMLIQIFGALPQHVSYIPLDLATGSLVGSLALQGFDRSQRTLCIMEGLLCYLPPPLVSGLLTEISREMAAGSSILFDYFPEYMVEGLCPSVAAENIRQHVASVGEPFLFGIPGSGVREFLGQFGFRDIRNVTDWEYLRELFPSDNTTRRTTGLLSFCHARI